MSQSQRDWRVVLCGRHRGRTNLDFVADEYVVQAGLPVVAAGLHKLNADFFAQESCANFGEWLSIWWELPFGLVIAAPLVVVVTSFSTYQSRLPWIEYGLLEALLVVVVVLVAGVGIARARQICVH